MILFINVFLQESSRSALGHPNNRYSFKDFSKQEIFLYTLESYKVIDWKEVIIYCGLDDNYTDKEQFYQQILKIFPEANLFKFRNAYQKEWQIAIDKICEIDDDLIWYAGNHDHPYLAPNNIQLDLIIEALNNCDEKYKGAIYSHHPDNLSWLMNTSFFDWKYESKGVCSYHAKRAEGIMIVNKALFRNWWFDYNYGDSFIPRADWVNGCKSELAKIFLPVNVLCHHFDGYNLGSYMYHTCDVPPLEIPEGFWDNQIIIDYCSNYKKEGNTLVNPNMPNKIIKDGADLRCMLEDLPLFWKGRIKKINYYEPDFNLKKIRNKVRFEAAAARRISYNQMLQKGMDSSFLLNYRPKVPLCILKDLFSFF